ncbi:LCP family protein [Nocardioides sp.]|uniref:LCP family protein n=1 Tax=Nocardioides sp. TaxID=35761 RepID=UPI00273355F0|nr:LCP family protein [Nocardioides sp.]MDP3890440.1 LCP family protein [Nocardioides sp.]
MSTEVEESLVVPDTSVPLVPERRRRRRHSSRWRRWTRRPRHFFRRHKAGTILAAIGVVLLILLLLFIWWLLGLLGRVPRFDIDLDRDNRPAYVGTGTNLLLAGVDDRNGADLHEMLAAPEWQKGVLRSDTIMVVHISEQGDHAQVVSIPRDSYVPVEGYGRTKINHAFSFGGPELLAAAVEDTIDMRIDHVLVADTEGFKGITEVIGGVPVYVSETVEDPQSNGVWTKGRHVLRGDSAMAYVRQRYNLPGGDFDRVRRQQNLLRGIAVKATQWNVLLNPFTVDDLVDEIAGHLAISDTLTDKKMRELVLTLRNLRVREISFMTAPNVGSDRVGAMSVVRLQRTVVRDLFEAVARDDFRSYAIANEVDLLPPAREVR